MPFHPALIDFCDEAIRGDCGRESHRLPSGPLHDAAEVSRAGIPTVMMFVQSLRGISHNKIEDTKEEHLEMAVGRVGQAGDQDSGVDPTKRRMSVRMLPTQAMNFQRQRQKITTKNASNTTSGS